MPVGAGSIKRAAKLNAGVESKAAEKKTTEKGKMPVKTQETETVVAESPKMVEKKATGKSATTTKKATAAKKTTEKKAAPKKSVEKNASTAKSSAEVQAIGSNQVCHLTEELPVYLL